MCGSCNSALKVVQLEWVIARHSKATPSSQPPNPLHTPQFHAIVSDANSNQSTKRGAQMHDSAATTVFTETIDKGTAQLPLFVGAGSRA